MKLTIKQTLIVEFDDERIDDINNVIEAMNNGTIQIIDIADFEIFTEDGCKVEMDEGEGISSENIIDLINGDIKKVMED